MGVKTYSDPSYIFSGMSRPPTPAKYAPVYLNDDIAHFKQKMSFCLTSLFFQDHSKFGRVRKLNGKRRSGTSCRLPCVCRGFRIFQAIVKSTLVRDADCGAEGDFCFQTRLTNRLTYLLTFFSMVLAHISILGSGYYDPHVSQSLSILSCCIHKMSSSKARNLSIFFESSCMLTKEQTNRRDSKHNTLATDELKIDDGGDR